MQIELCGMVFIKRDDGMVSVMQEPYCGHWTPLPFRYRSFMHAARAMRASMLQEVSHG